MKKQTFALFFGNRGFMPAELIKGARVDMVKAVTDAGYDYIIMDEDATRYGAVETRDEGRAYAKWLKSHEGEYDGVILCMPIFIDENGAIAALQDAVDGKLKHCFIELSACEGACVGGPAFLKRDKRIAVSVADVQDSALDGTEDDFEVSEDITMESTMRSTPVYRPEPSAEQLEKILNRMGKKNPEDELNCGICGYSTCREKAKAVFLGRADIDMCLPYMKEKAESYSDKIVGVSPNAIVTVGRDLRVKQINQAACDIFAIRKREDIIGYPVSRILDEFDFVRMLSGDGRQTTNYTYLSDYNVYLEQVFLCDEDREIVTCIMKDVTQSRQKKKHIRQVKLRTASMADEIVEKQMRIAHEIASLLGETVAETKVAVNDLKNTILMDEDKDEQR